MKTNDLIIHINDKRDSYQLHFEGKSNVKYQLFWQLLDELGWDMKNPYHCIFGFLEIGEQAESDVLFDQKGEPIILFEIKGIKENIDNHIEQTKRFFSVENSIKVAILSNMVDMYFFSDFETPGVMDETPFYKIYLPSFTQQDVDFLEQFQRDYFLDHFRDLYAKWKEQYLL
ncbi:hypothetical protein [Neobacillus jeddahensis]|uniref:hypothetical protein n=1 Tax=Neobacillus jeddahensis TaxID=1461580 RepID=UPI00058B3495|nr:hypothetical protein [Neobacillus jeddahensis]